jgi:lipopolysaccharide transport system ATP-binding protein
MKNALISLKSIGVRYRKRRSFFRHEYFEALKDISFEVYSGETLGIIGRNGAGKSTLLRILAGIYKPDKGFINRNTQKVSLLSLQLGFDPELSGRDNAIFSGMLLGFPRKVVENNLKNISEFSELGDFFDESVKTYSAGMRARLGFSVAHFLTPDVLLIDEVLGVGDAKFRQKAETAMIEKLRSEQTVVLVSHAAQQVRRLCSRVIWIEAGKVRLQGEPHRVVSAYHQYYGIKLPQMPLGPKK